MILTYAEGKYILNTSYKDYQEHGPKIKAARFRWDPQAKRWWTDKDENASLLIGAADDATRARLQSLADRRQSSIAASQAKDAELKHDLLRPPYPFQRAGIAAALTMNRVLFADEMGLGKSLQALATVHLKKSYPCIAVVPASLKLNWQRECEMTCQELKEPGSVVIVNGLANGRAQDFMREHGAAKFWIINYDILYSWLDLLKELRAKSVILDEIHFAKNPKAKRSKACLALSQLIDQVYGLTGTPLLNRPKELPTQLEILGVLGQFGGAFRFLKRYCDGHKETIYIPGGRGKTREVWNFDGASHLDELQRELRSKVMIRRTKDEVLTELPPIRHQIIEFPPNGLRDYIEEEERVQHEWRNRIEQAELERDAAESLGDHESFAEAARRVQQCYAASFQEIARLRHLTALAKVPLCLEHHKETLETIPKLVIMAHHHDVIEQLMEGLKEYRPVRLTGLENKDQKQAAIDAFQNGESRVFIGSIKAAGVGINLTAASLMQFDELDFTPGWMDQAAARIHRIGQLDSVLIQYLVLDGSIDGKLVGMLVEKSKIADAALDDPLLDFTIKAEDPTHKDRKPASDPAFTDSEKAAMLGMLRLLAGLDFDYATEQNDIGFNKIDGPFGHKLAGLPYLTDKQAAVAKRMLRKYWRQVQPELYDLVYPGVRETMK